MDPVTICLIGSSFRADEGGRFPQEVRLVGVLPGEVRFGAAEVPVGRGLAVDGAMEVQVLAERGRAEIEMLLDQLEYPRLGHALGPERLDQQGQRARDADRVSHLQLDAVGESRRYDVLRDVPGG